MVKTINNNIDFGKRGNWKQVKLKDIAVKKNKKNKDSSISTVFSNSALNGIVEQKDFFDKDIANKNHLSSYYIVEEDDFVYNPRISSQAPYGPISRNKTNKTGLVSPLYTVFKLEQKKCCLDYFEQYFKSSCWHKYMYSVANYGARSDRMNITSSDFFNMEIKVPQLMEQQKIASILSTWDKAIELKEKLIEQKKKQKKGFMQKLLTSEVRLPGFKGEWKEVKLEEVVKKTKGKPIKYSDNGKYPAIDMEYLESGKFKNYSNDRTVYASKDDVLLLWDGSRAGMAFTGIEGTVGSTFVKLECTNINNIFLQKHLELNMKRIQKLREGSGIPHIPKDLLSYYKIKLPCMDEQNVISTLLLRMDKKIDLLQKEIRFLKQQKKGLMQQLLTGKIRVKV